MDVPNEEILHLCEYYDFIKRELSFYSYKDFLDNAEQIKKIFVASTKYEKQLYKLYIYANTHIKLTHKDFIWDFLNGYKDFANLLYLRYNCI